MTEETNSVVQELDKTGAQVDPKESDATGVDPQGTAEQGENEQEKKRKGGWQRKIEKLERENEYWRGQVLRTQSEQPKEAVAKVEAKPKPVWAEYEAAGKSEQYFEDLARWTAADEAKALRESLKAEARQEKTQTEEQKIAAKWQESVAAFRSEHSDFNEVMSLAHPSKLLEDLVVRHKEGVAIAYHLANNPDVEERLSRMTDAGDIREELGLIRAQLAQEKPAAAEEEINSEPPAKPLPKPPTPIQKSSSVSKRFDPLDPSSYGHDFTVYEKHMAERDKRRAKG